VFWRMVWYGHQLFYFWYIKVFIPASDLLLLLDLLKISAHNDGVPRVMSAKDSGGYVKFTPINIILG
jgi:hypothetical protein